MKKIIATVVMALAAANANALMNPNKVHVLANGARVTTAQAEQIYDKQISQLRQQLKAQGKKPTAWDYAASLNGVPCGLAEHLMGRLNDRESNSFGKVYDAYMNIMDKCMMSTEEELYRAG